MSLFRSPLSTYQRKGIVDTHQAEDIEDLLNAEVEAGRNIGNLRQRIREQGQAIEELRAVVAVVTKLLSASGHLDTNVLEHRIEAELDLQRSQPPTATCGLCGRLRPMSAISLTADGAICAGSCTAP